MYGRVIFLVDLDFIQGFWIFHLYFIVNNIIYTEIWGKFLFCFVPSTSSFMLLLETKSKPHVDEFFYLQNLNKKSKIMPLFF